MNFLARWMMIAALCGCATAQQSRSAPNTASAQNEQAASAAGSEGRLVCRKEAVIGSHRKQRVCRRESDSQNQRDAVQTQKGRTTSGPATADQPAM